MNTKLPAITVVIPLYNKANHIIDTLNTVRNQTYAPDEIIVVDDGSSDGGADVVVNLGIKNLRVIRQQNAGVSAARNRGIEESKTELIALLDGDDQWLPHFLEEIVKLHIQYPEAGIYGSNYQYRTQHEFYSPKLSTRFVPTVAGLMPDFIKAMADGDVPITMSSIVLQRKLFDKIGGFPIGEPMGEDQDFLFRAALNTHIAYTPKILALYLTETDNRACVRHVPDKECPFSVRLGEIAKAANPELKNDLNRCRAAHIFHLIKRNTKANKIDAAVKLLENDCCKIKPTHFLYWALKLQLRSFLNFRKLKSAINSLKIPLIN